WEMPAVSINDAPRFTYRGVMLDPCRHFLPSSLEKKNWQFLICHPRFLKCRQRGGDAVLYT
ncbi:hypothetical protein JVW08_20250, partial [Vibrio cholerae O1]|uniref:hypothetical protein n=1 Tax=Vibrio cholerae TaxID=666 RepID=UPI001C0F9753